MNQGNVPIITLQEGVRWYPDFVYNRNYISCYYGNSCMIYLIFTHGITLVSVETALIWWRHAYVLATCIS